MRTPRPERSLPVLALAVTAGVAVVALSGLMWVALIALAIEWWTR